MGQSEKSFVQNVAKKLKVFFKLFKNPTIPTVFAE